MAFHFKQIAVGELIVCAFVYVRAGKIIAGQQLNTFDVALHFQKPGVRDAVVAEPTFDWDVLINTIKKQQISTDLSAPDVLMFCLFQ